MAQYLKDPPSFVKNIGAWEYVLAKLANKQADDGKQRLDEGGNPLNYGQAVAIYKAVVKKYSHFNIPNINIAPVNMADAENIPGHHTPKDLLDELIDSYPIGKMFWYDDVLCEAVERHGGLAVYPDPMGYLLIQAKVLDVDPEGKYRNWPVGKVFSGRSTSLRELLGGVMDRIPPVILGILLGAAMVDLFLGACALGKYIGS